MIRKQIPSELCYGHLSFHRIPKTSWFYCENFERGKLVFGSVAQPYNGGGVGQSCALYATGRFVWATYSRKERQQLLKWLPFAQALHVNYQKYGEWRVADQVKSGQPFPVLETAADTLKRLLKK